MSTELQPLQQQIVIETVQSIDGDWQSILVNIEIDELEGDTVSSPFAEYQRDGLAEEFELSIEATELFEQLRTLMATHVAPFQPWVSCDLTIDVAGATHFSFTYGKAPRLAALQPFAD